MSPFLSIAGPDVVRIPTPISLAMMCARVVFPEPGRPRQQDVVERLAPALRRGDVRFQVRDDGPLADELGQPLRTQRHVGRRFRLALVRVKDPAVHSSPFGPVVPAASSPAPGKAPQRLPEQRVGGKLRRPSPAGPPRPRTAIRPARTPAPPALPTPRFPAPRAAAAAPSSGENSIDTFFSRSGSSRAIRCASFFPIPGTRVKTAASPRAQPESTPVDAQHRQDGERGFRADAAHPDRREEDLPLRFRGEAEEVAAALAEVEVRPQETALPFGRKLFPRGGGDVRAEPDPGALHHDEILPAAGEASSQVVDHRRTS